MRNSFTEPGFIHDNSKIESLSGTLCRIMSRPVLKRSKKNYSDSSENLRSKDLTLDEIQTQLPLADPRSVNKGMSTSSTSRWSKVRTIYQCVRKFKNPSYRQLNGLDSLHDDLTTFVRNKEQHQRLFGSTTIPNEFNTSNIDADSEFNQSKENYVDQNQIYRAAKQLELMMKISSQHETTRQLFELAADGSESATEKLIELIKQDIS
jgi:hypothetical protein